MAAPPVYFDTSVFLAMLSGDPVEGPLIREILRELKRDKVRIYTSIITVQEVSVQSFRRGNIVTDNHSKVAKLARIAGITKEMALTAAKYEAAVKEQAMKSGESKTDENRRRKWDCFHLAAAVCLNCKTFYACDAKFDAKRKVLGLESTLKICRPRPSTPLLVKDLYSETAATTTKSV